MDMAIRQIVIFKAETWIKQAWGWPCRPIINLTSFEHLSNLCSLVSCVLLLFFSFQNEVSVHEIKPKHNPATCIFQTGSKIMENTYSIFFFKRGKNIDNFLSIPMIKVHVRWCFSKYDHIVFVGSFWLCKNVGQLMKLDFF